MLLVAIVIMTFMLITDMPIVDVVFMSTIGRMDMIMRGQLTIARFVRFHSWIRFTSRICFLHEDQLNERK